MITLPSRHTQRLHNWLTIFTWLSWFSTPCTKPLNLITSLMQTLDCRMMWSERSHARSSWSKQSYLYVIMYICNPRNHTAYLLALLRLTIMSVKIDICMERRFQPLDAKHIPEKRLHEICEIHDVLHHGYVMHSPVAYALCNLNRYCINQVCTHIVPWTRGWGCIRFQVQFLGGGPLLKHSSGYLMQAAT